MKAAYMLNKGIHVGELPDPTPTEGQVLVRTHRCGICASDLHLVHHGERIVKWSRDFNGPFRIDLERPVVLGHEFVAEVLEYGPRTEKAFETGTRVTSLLSIPTPQGEKAYVGLSNDFPGGFGEYMLLPADILRKVPDSLATDLAVLTEPLSVGLHHARYGKPQPDDVPLVVGCGAIGLAVIAGLKLLGLGPIIATDFDASRRELAGKMGADVVFDPRERSPYVNLPEAGGRAPNVIYECVGVPGVMDQILQQATYRARIISGGWCLEPDYMFTPAAHTKQLTIMFAGGEEQEDFDLALHALATGKVDGSHLLGSTVGLSGVAAALEGLADPRNPIRVLVDPRQA
ncbi:zinc-binding dehydrogenase [Novosphingobium sp. BL-52-GroH]|uniref:zinc-binding dehydrogenase n=1 Tax=Novosphingobium sp. BL-52-GroH TaxID=3349877 RepID=UPI00384A90E4